MGAIPYRIPSHGLANRLRTARQMEFGPWYKHNPIYLKCPFKHTLQKLHEKSLGSRSGETRNGHVNLLFGYQPLSRANPNLARSATAFASVTESFSDSGRSRRIPNFAAYARKAISTS